MDSEQYGSLTLLDFIAMFLHQLHSEEMAPMWLCIKKEIRERKLMEARELYGEWVRAEMDAAWRRT